jgi:murein DD-endopeptidase MepM/ murein hydrolase activator NlpD
MANILTLLLQFLTRLFPPSANAPTAQQPQSSTLPAYPSPKPSPPPVKPKQETQEVAVQENLPKAKTKVFDWTSPVVRKDGWGSGSFSAGRGKRTHQGVDYEIEPDAQILSPVDGVVTNHSVPYPGDKKFRGIQITTFDKKEVKIFYCKPLARLGAKVKKGDVVATAQDVSSKYNALQKDVEAKGLMKPHLHVELRIAGKLANPKVLVTND